MYNVRPWSEFERILECIRYDPSSEFVRILECITTYNHAANSCESLSLVTWEVRVVVIRFQRPQRVVDDSVVGFVGPDVQDDVFHRRFGLEGVNKATSVQVNRQQLGNGRDNDPNTDCIQVERSSPAYPYRTNYTSQYSRYVHFIKNYLTKKIAIQGTPQN